MARRSRKPAWLQTNFRPPYAARNREGSASASASASVSDWRRMRAAKASGAPLRYYGSKTAEADEKRGVVEDTEGRVAAQDFSGEEACGLGGRSRRVPDLPAGLRPGRGANGALPCARRRGWRGGGRQLRAHHVIGTGSHREEAAGPLSPWKQGALRRFLRLQPALPVLPERFHRLRRASATCPGAKSHRPSWWNRPHRLCPKATSGSPHLQRAARGPRVRS